jgi:hypothetical protein
MVDVKQFSEHSIQTRIDAIDNGFRPFVVLPCPSPPSLPPPPLESRPTDTLETSWSITAGFLLSALEGKEGTLNAPEET